MTDIHIRGYRSEDEPALLALGTSDENAEKVYGRFGFKETRRFAVLRRQL